MERHRHFCTLMSVIEGTSDVPQVDQFIPMIAKPNAEARYRRTSAFVPKQGAQFAR